MKPFLRLLIFTFLLLVSYHLSAGTNPGDEANPLTINIINAKTGKPEKGVSVLVKTNNSENKLTTDDKGNLQIPFTKGEVTFVLEKRGFKTISYKKNLQKSDKPLKMQLESEKNNHSEIFHPLYRFIENW